MHGDKHLGIAVNARVCPYRRQVRLTVRIKTRLYPFILHSVRISDRDRLSESQRRTECHSERIVCRGSVDSHSGYGGQERYVKYAVVSCAIPDGKPGAVYAKHHR